jgi:hypothetical protein
MELGYLLLALIVCLPVMVLVIMTKLRDMHQATLQFLKESQVVGGSPVHLIEKRAELVAEQTKDARDRAAYLSDEMKRRAVQALG